MKISVGKLAAVGALLGLSLLAWPAAAAATDKAPITVFAAASLTNALQDLGDGFTKETSIPEIGRASCRERV